MLCSEALRIAQSGGDRNRMSTEEMLIDEMVINTLSKANILHQISDFSLKCIFKIGRASCRERVFSAVYISLECDEYKIKHKLV